MFHTMYACYNDKHNSRLSIKIVLVICFKILNIVVNKLYNYTFIANKNTCMYTFAGDLLFIIITHLLIFRLWFVPYDNNMPLKLSTANYLRWYKNVCIFNTWNMKASFDKKLSWRNRIYYRNNYIEHFSKDNASKVSK